MNVTSGWFSTLCCWKQLSNPLLIVEKGNKNDDDGLIFQTLIFGFNHTGSCGHSVCTKESRNYQNNSIYNSESEKTSRGSVGSNPKGFKRCSV